MFEKFALLLDDTEDRSYTYIMDFVPLLLFQLWSQAK